MTLVKQTSYSASLFIFRLNLVPFDQTLMCDKKWIRHIIGQPAVIQFQWLLNRVFVKKKLNHVFGGLQQVSFTVSFYRVDKPLVLRYSQLFGCFSENRKVVAFRQDYTRLQINKYFNEKYLSSLHFFNFSEIYFSKIFQLV